MNVNFDLLCILIVSAVGRLFPVVPELITASTTLPNGAWDLVAEQIFPIVLLVGAVWWLVRRDKIQGKQLLDAKDELVLSHKQRADDLKELALELAKGIVEESTQFRKLIEKES